MHESMLGLTPADHIPHNPQLPPLELPIHRPVRLLPVADDREAPKLLLLDLDTLLGFSSSGGADLEGREGGVWCGEGGQGFEFEGEPVRIEAGSIAGRNEVSE